MYELPLFPLNTVLFPGMPLPLHIFEPRYREMVQDCLDQQRPFGVVLIRDGVAEGGPVADPHKVGCVAEIIEVQHLEDGRLLLITIGQERFRILSLSHQLPYLMGSVEEMPFVPENEALLLAARQQLLPWLLEYLQILANAGQVEFDPGQMPEDPEEMLYLAAAVLQIEAGQKQQFLESEKASVVLGQLTAVYKRELLYLRLMPKEDQGIFSLN
jgi:uncharacterized protein